MHEAMPWAQSLALQKEKRELKITETTMVVVVLKVEETKLWIKNLASDDEYIKMDGSDGRITFWDVPFVSEVCAQNY